jgi:tRNA(Ile)-lysidine synthase
LGRYQQNSSEIIVKQFSSLHHRLHRTLRQQQLLPAQQRLLVAVSGGQDSLCLWQLLADLQDKWHWELAIVHCDHGWELDIGLADHVAQFAQAAGVQFHLQVADPSLSLQPTEANARAWRYAALIEIAQTHNYPYVVTGHTQSDRAETLLHNLIRGSGADGLQSLTWQRFLALGIQLIRPLLGISRSETGAFCQQHHLPVWEDPYNQDLKYTRSRIRHQLLPLLTEDFNPQVEVALAQTAEVLRAEVAYLEALAQEIFDEAKTEVNNLPCLQCSRLQRTPLALQRRVLRQFLLSSQVSPPNFMQIEELVSLITAPNGSRTATFPGGHSFQVVEKHLCLMSVRDHLEPKN